MSDGAVDIEISERNDKVNHRMGQQVCNLIADCHLCVAWTSRSVSAEDLSQAVVIGC